MGQPCSSCSSGKNKHKNKASQKVRDQSVSQNSRENINDHYAQGNMAIPHEPIPQIDFKKVNEKADENENPKQFSHPENEKHVQNPDDEKSSLGLFDSEESKQEVSFEKGKEDLKNEAQEISAEHDRAFVKKSDDDENNEQEFSQNKAKKDDSFEVEEEEDDAEEGDEEEEEEDKDDDNNENPDGKPSHFSRVEREEEQDAFENAETECPICLESFETFGEEPVFTTCGHAFCFKCLKGTLKIRPYCPLCRTYQSKPLSGAEGQKLYDLNNRRNLEPLAEEQWNVEVVRAHLREIPGEKGNRRVYLSNGEATNIYVGKGAKVNVAPNTNLFINGKRVNPQDCNVQ